MVIGIDTAAPVGAGQHCSSALLELSPVMFHRIHTPLSAPAARQVVGLYAFIPERSLLE